MLIYKDEMETQALTNYGLFVVIAQMLYNLSF